MAKLLRHISGMAAGQVSARVLYVLVALAVAVFALFFIVGYDRPYPDNPSFNAPLLTDAVLWFIYALTACACAAALCSLARALRLHDKSDDVVNNLPAAKIKRLTFGLLALLLALTYMSGSAEPVLANGVRYTDAVWLKIADMFLNTSLALLAVAALGVAFGLSGLARRLGTRGKRRGQTTPETQP